MRLERWLMKEHDERDNFEFDDGDAFNPDCDGYKDEAYDAYYDKELSQYERVSLIKNNIALNMLKDITIQQKDDIEFFATLYELYEMGFDFIMTYASERLSDLYDVGVTYLSPLFKFENDKFNYMISMIREWDRLTNKKEIYGYKNILSKVYKMPNDYIKYSLKYVYTRNEYCESSIREKLKFLIRKIKSRRTKTQNLSDDDTQKLLKHFEEMTRGEKGKDIAWLIEYNQQSVIKSNEESFDEPLGAEGPITFSKENFEIMCYIDTLATIISKPQLTENDKHMFVTIMRKLDNYANLGRQQREFVEAHQDFES